MTGRNICRCLGCRGVNRRSDLGHQTRIVYYGPVVTFLISWGILYLLLTAQSWDLPSGFDLFFFVKSLLIIMNWDFLCKFNREGILNFHTFLILKKGQNPLCPPIIMILSNDKSTAFLSDYYRERLKSGGGPWTTPPALGFAGLFKHGYRHNLVWTPGSKCVNVPEKQSHPVTRCRSNFVVIANAEILKEQNLSGEPRCRGEKRGLFVDLGRCHMKEHDWILGRLGGSLGQSKRGWSGLPGHPKFGMKRGAGAPL